MRLISKSARDKQTTLRRKRKQRRLEVQNLESRIVMAQGVTDFVDIKNVDQQLSRVVFDDVDKDSVFIGGGKSNAAETVGEEFAEITGGTRIHADELDDILASILTASKWEAPGLEGVDLVSISTESFTIGIDGVAGSTNFIEFSGSVAEDAIESVLFKHVDLKNKASQVTLFDTDNQNKVFTGSSNAASDEARALIGGSSLKTHELVNLFKAVVSGNESNGTAGVEGVELVGLTDTGFTLRIEGQGATVDTIIVTGSAAVDAINAADAERTTDVKDAQTALDVFDVATENKEFIGGANGELNQIIGGVLKTDDVLDLFEALVSGNGRNGNTHGVDNVELIGLSKTSFAIRIASAGGNYDYILFKNVHTLEGADELGFVG